MTGLDLHQRAQKLAEEIRAATGEARLSNQADFSKLLEEMHLAGQEVPRALKQLELDLCEEAVERRFDNMPV